jgi:hypothetical protein
MTSFSGSERPQTTAILKLDHTRAVNYELQ